MMNVEVLFRDALILAKDPDANFVKLGQRLTELRDKSPDRFQALVEQSELSGRKAYYLLRIAEGLASLEERGTELNEDQLRRIGWTKLKVIATGLTPRNAAKRLRMAEQHTARELATYMRGEKPALKEHAILLYFTPEQYQVFEEAILQNGGARKPKGRGLLHKEEALIRVLRQSRSP